MAKSSHPSPLHKPDVRKANICPPCPKDASHWDRLIYWLGIGLGSGMPKRAAGTWGTVGGLIIALLLMSFGFWVFLTITIIGCLIGSYICGHTSELMDVHDDPHIVFDEWVGIWITLCGFLYAVDYNPFRLMNLFYPDVWLGAWQWLIVLVCFLLFRFFDIIKPFPIRWIDQRISGGFGILLDDVIAGLMAVVTLFIGLKLLTYIV